VPFPSMSAAGNVLAELPQNPRITERSPAFTVASPVRSARHSQESGIPFPLMSGSGAHASPIPSPSQSA
jgi:hypothetical protein